MSKQKLAICFPIYRQDAKPHPATIDAIGASVPLLDEAGYEHAVVSEVMCPYISQARNTCLRKALDWGAETIVFIDHDVSWAAESLLKLVQTQGDMVAGTYRYTRAGGPEEPEDYMGSIYCGEHGTPLVRDDGAIKAEFVPAGFLKLTRAGINAFMAAYPELQYGERCRPHIDLFQHGAHDWLWYGEDYALSRRWREIIGPIWLVPDMDIVHWRGDTAYPGNYSDFLRRRPGGDLSFEASEARYQSDDIGRRSAA